LCYSCAMKKDDDFQDVNIRHVPVGWVRQLRSVLAINGQSLKDWFITTSTDTISRGHDLSIKKVDRLLSKGRRAMRKS
jgi:hypothetical protein